MIVKNEQTMIGQCLESVKNVVDEINIVDTGSTDQTKEIVAAYTNRIFDYKWRDDFGAARNFSFSKATKDYILWLDADDILLEEDANKLKELKRTLSPEVNCVTFKYHYASDSDGNPTLVFRRERLVKRSKNFKWVGFIHEYIGTQGNTLDADIAVTHKRVHGISDRNLTIYRKKLSEGIQLSTRDICYYGKELYYHRLFDEAIEVLEGFVKGPAWIEDIIDAYCKIGDCYEAKGELQRARKILYESFECVPPRAEVIYRIAGTFQKEKKIQEAIFWYNSILSAKMPETSSGFISPEYWTWRPHLELCVCYYQIGDIEKSIYHNQQAAKYVPYNESVQQNTRFFQTLQLNRGE